ncbi:MAG: TVP38/TMEM64 family protein [Clostridiaceae bacterium]
MNQPSLTRGKHLKWYVLGAIVLAVAAYFCIPAVKTYIDRIAGVLASADVSRVVEYIRSYGAYAMAISFLLMVFQSIIAPLPAFLITFANAAVFGWWQGALLSWASAMVGAMLCFFIARALGRDTVEKIAGKGTLKGVEAYFTKYGSKTILVCRLLPFVSFDAVSYFAGLTSIGFWSFVVATGIGQLPATIVYSYVGGMLTGGVKYFMTALLCIFALSAAIAIIKGLYNERQKAKKTQETDSEQPSDADSAEANIEEHN